MSRRRQASAGLALTCSLLWTAGLGPASSRAGEEPVHRYRPERRLPSPLEPILRHVSAGHDEFPEEKAAEEIGARLAELGRLLRTEDVTQVARLLAPEFRGTRLPPAQAPRGGGPLDVHRTDARAGEPSRDRGSFAAEIGALTSDFRDLQVAELLVTRIEADASSARTEVRYDLAGTGQAASRVEKVGRWRMTWRRSEGGTWRVAEWSALDHVGSRAASTVFTEVTAGALSSNASFGRQLVPGLDEWASRLDAVFMSGGMGHHGVSAGDADGDGLDDLYVSQPSGLPNRLFRNRGDGTFEDVTAAAGAGILDSTSQSLFADVDNDGDQDLVLVTRSGLLLLANDGKGRFARVPDAFRFEGLRGAPTSIAIADYDRDGFLDVYLCTYSYFIGASEDKAGQPVPYHDARNGPPNVLLRNDGRGRFLDVTEEAGLGQNNDRFSFAAAWADYDEDGWPDLVVANDFGRKNLYRNQGLKEGRVTFRDVAPEAGVEDYGAGMSTTWLDYDNDGRLDLYTGNMWTAAGLRVTHLPGFKPDAPPEVREIYRRHARGNSLFRNRGDGTFADVTLAAGAEMGRWAWSSDVLDFDSDGWDDLYVVNGMFTRAPGEEDVDLDSFFWRQVTARSPLEERRGTPFDDAWRATNRILAANGSQARHERNVLLRNDGKGGFDEVSGAAGLDLEQDGRSFAVLDYDGDGDTDLAVMAARSSPQLRVFRNDLETGHHALAVRLVGTKSNRDAVGARVTVKTDRLRRTRALLAGSGFISQHSKELLFGLGRSGAVLEVSVKWPSGATQTLRDLPLDHRVWIEEGGPVRTERLAGTSVRASRPAAPTPAAQPEDRGTWLYEPYPAPDFTLRDLEGRERALSRLRGPALLLFWATWAPPSRSALQELARQRPRLAAAGVEAWAVSVDAPEDEARVRAAAEGLVLPVMVATPEVAGTYSILHRYLFDRRQDLPLPTAFLLSPAREIVKVYGGALGAWAAEDAHRLEVSTAERLARAVPFEGAFETLPGERNYFQYSLDLAEHGFDAAALEGFDRVARRDPSAITFYNLGTLHMRSGSPDQARAAFERALALQPQHAEASNSLGALLAQSGDVSGALARFRAALEARPDFSDALNNLGYALLEQGEDERAHELFERALEVQPDFPEAFNNLGILFGQQGDLDRAESYFRRAVVKRPGYGEAANNLALVLANRGDTEGAVRVLRRVLDENPAFEMAYVTLCRLYLDAGEGRKGAEVLERLLQRNPKHPLGLELLKQLRAGG